ncbi:MAG TPA: hypothetical protein VF691_07070 [Cytophagaceae bacterium]|jgi:hypothetical protein
MNVSLNKHHLKLILALGVGLLSCNRAVQKNTSIRNAGPEAAYSSSHEKISIEDSPASISASAEGAQLPELSAMKEYDAVLPPKSFGTTHANTLEVSKDVKTQNQKVKILKRKISQLKQKSIAHYAPFSKGTGIALSIGGLVLIVLGIAFLTQLGVLLGSIIAGAGVIVFLIGFLGLVL